MKEVTLTTSQRIRRALGWTAVGVIAWHLLIAPVAVFALELYGYDAPEIEPVNIRDLLQIVTHATAG